MSRMGDLMMGQGLGILNRGLACSKVSWPGTPLFFSLCAVSHSGGEIRWVVESNLICSADFGVVLPFFLSSFLLYCAVRGRVGKRGEVGGSLLPFFTPLPLFHSLLLPLPFLCVHGSTRGLDNQSATTGRREC